MQALGKIQSSLSLSRCDTRNCHSACTHYAVIRDDGSEIESPCTSAADPVISPLPDWLFSLPHRAVTLDPSRSVRLYRGRNPFNRDPLSRPRFGRRIAPGVPVRVTHIGGITISHR